MPDPQVAAIIASVLIAVVICFQIGLAAGMPWGRSAWGGQNPGALPPRLRVASLIAAVVLALMAWIVLAAADLVTAPVPRPWLTPATWVIAAYFGVGTLMNAVSRSKVERLWAPPSLAAALLCAVVALG